jgi:Met-10+ like-protein
MRMVIFGLELVNYWLIFNVLSTIHTSSHIYLQTYAYIHTHMHTRFHINVLAFTYTYSHEHIYEYIHSYIYVNKHAYSLSHKRTRFHIHVLTRTHIEYIHSYIYVNNPSPDLNPASYKYLKNNSEKNHCGKFLAPFNMDGRLFIMDLQASAIDFNHVR